MGAFNDMINKATQDDLYEIAHSLLDNGDMTMNPGLDNVVYYLQSGWDSNKQEPRALTPADEYAISFIANLFDNGDTHKTNLVQAIGRNFKDRALMMLAQAESKAFVIKKKQEAGIDVDPDDVYGLYAAYHASMDDALRAENQGIKRQVSSGEIEKRAITTGLEPELFKNARVSIDTFTGGKKSNMPLILMGGAALVALVLVAKK